jgi:hypothetical protein
VATGGPRQEQKLSGETQKHKKKKKKKKKESKYVARI